jgi:predicted Ser/Thr protein kinase/WD40 repeat protein
MPLTPCDKLGPYEILAPIGAGGMGEVYRARDTRLNRDVAIKVSQERFSDRFEREARAVAALNHPNICTLYDFGPDHLVMELVEGQTLGERMKQGAIPLDEALAIAKQIAAALEAAHQKGITHRDLKPGNIILNLEGAVKVLDFGLAKMGSLPTAQTEDSPTFTMDTRAGVILGTAAYMAPEQARGKGVDGRADIWAFGVVLYEMTTGEKLFKGDDVSEILAAVIKEEPRLERAPSRLRRLLRSCLEKDPKQRLQAIGDWRLLLEESAASEPASRALWLGVVTVLFAALVVALWAPWRPEKPIDRPLVRLDVDLGSDVSLPETDDAGSTVAISPDGTRLAYLSGTPVKLFTRALDQTKATELVGTQDASPAFFSPDGRWVGFHSNGKLNKISVDGGTVVPLGDVGGANFAGASWNEDDTIFVSIGFQRGLLRFPAAGGQPESVAGLGNDEIFLRNPQTLPGGRAILFSVVRTLGRDRRTIEVLTLSDSHRKVVARGGSFPRYLPTSSGATSNRIGHLVYVNGATLFAIPFDLAKLETRGTAVPVLNDVEGSFDFSLAPSGHGTLVYRRASGETALSTLQWVAQTGHIEPLRAKPRLYGGPIRVSPDGTRVALTADGDKGIPDTWVYDTQRDAMTRLTFGGAMYRWPSWSPDGKYVVGTSDGNGMFQARADGASQPQVLTQSKPFQFPCSFTPDGKRLAYFETAGDYQIWTVPLEDIGNRLKAGKPEQFLKTNFNDVGPSFSPDGRWIAYASNESGEFEVYVRTFPAPSSGQGGKWQISSSGGMWPRWSHMGHELFYENRDQILAASYTVAADRFVADKPRVWLAKFGGTDWDVAPDGKRLLVVTPVDSANAAKQQHEVVFLENFFDYLRQRVPLGK